MTNEITRCGLCDQQILADSTSHSALFVGRICFTCEQQFKRDPMSNAAFYNKLKNKPDQKYVRAFESGKSNPDGITVRHSLTQPDGSIAESTGPKQLTAAGYIKKEKL